MYLASTESTQTNSPVVAAQCRTQCFPSRDRRERLFHWTPRNLLTSWRPNSAEGTIDISVITARADLAHANTHFGDMSSGTALAANISADGFTGRFQESRYPSPGLITVVRITFSFSSSRTACEARHAALIAWSAAPENVGRMAGDRRNINNVGPNSNRASPGRQPA